MDPLQTSDLTEIEAFFDEPCHMVRYHFRKNDYQLGRSFMEEASRLSGTLLRFESPVILLDVTSALLYLSQDKLDGVERITRQFAAAAAASLLNTNYPAEVSCHLGRGEARGAFGTLTGSTRCARFLPNVTPSVSPSRKLQA
jgi:hypothetical protein